MGPRQRAAIVLLTLLAGCAGRPANVAIQPYGDSWWCYRARGPHTDKYKLEAGSADAVHYTRSICVRNADDCAGLLAQEHQLDASEGKKGNYEGCFRQEKAVCVTSQKKTDSKDYWYCYADVSDCEWFSGLRKNSQESKNYEYLSRCDVWGSRSGQ